MEEKKSDVSAAGGQKSGKLKKYAAIILILILAGAGYAWYSYNLPEKRLARALEEADALLEAKLAENRAETALKRKVRADEEKGHDNSD